MLRRALLPASLALLAAAPGSAAAAAEHVRGEVIVRYARGTEAADRAATERAAGLTRPLLRRALARAAHRGRRSRGRTVAELRRRPRRARRTPNYVARARLVPNDPGRAACPAAGRPAVELPARTRASTRPPRGTTSTAAGRPGGAGVTVAVLDTGVAYRDRGRFRALARPSYAAVRARLRLRRRRPYPDDQNGHGTHVASTIAERADNGRADRPGVRRADHARAGAGPLGEGDSADDRRAASATRPATARRSSTSRSSSAATARRATSRRSSTRCATPARRGVLVVGASGNASAPRRRLPRARATTCCPSARSPSTAARRLLEPRHGLDLVGARRRPRRALPAIPTAGPTSRPGRDILQMTFTAPACGASASRPATWARRWPRRTSRRPPRWSSPRASSAQPAAGRDRGAPRRPPPPTSGRPGRDRRYGAGLVDAAAATTPAA